MGRDFQIAFLIFIVQALFMLLSYHFLIRDIRYEMDSWNVTITRDNQ